MRSLKDIAPFVRPYWWIVILSVLTVVLPVAMELVVPRSLQYIIDDGIRANSMEAIVRGSSIMLVAAAIGAIATLGQGFCRAWLSQNMAFDMRNALFGQIQAFSFGNLDTMQTGQLMTRLSSDVDIVRMFTSAGLSLMLRAVLMIAGSLFMMVLIDWRLFLVVIVILAFAIGLIWALMRTARPLFLVVQEKLARLNTIVQENLAGVQVVKAFVRERHEIAQFEDSSIDYMDGNIKVGRLMAVALPLLTILTNVGIVLIIWLGGADVINGQLSVGELIAFNNYLMIGMAPLLLLGNVLTMVSRADASAERILDVLGTEPVVRPALRPYKAKEAVGRVALGGVSFHYDGNGGDHVLNGLNLAVEPGQCIAVLGATGSGKSTLVNLIPRFYDVTGGHVQIDDIDVRKWDLRTLRSRIGVVLQQTTLFSGTIRENIAYGKPDATLDEVVEAARAAQAHDFVLAMPNGYDSPVEARGANLSGGQRQRIAIARALLISPSILILDDSTSAVDLETEVKIQRALDQLMADRTTFVVAQRINSVINADQIIVLDSGRVAAQGTHADLLKTSPIYQEIYRSQLGDDDPSETALTTDSGTAGC